MLDALGVGMIRGRGVGRAGAYRTKVVWENEHLSNLALLERGSGGADASASVGCYSGARRFKLAVVPKVTQFALAAVTVDSISALSNPRARRLHRIPRFTFVNVDLAVVAFVAAGTLAATFRSCPGRLATILAQLLARSGVTFAP